MRRLGPATEGAKRALLQSFLLGALLCCVATTGCDNTCVSGALNPPTGTVVIKVNNAKPTCTLSKANGTVRLQMTTSSMPSAVLRPPGVQHIFVSIRGIVAHPGTIADADASDWQELTPQLAQQPMQVDLMARAADFCAQGSFGEGTVPAGVYREIRLRLVPNQPATSEPVPEENMCGSIGFNCIVGTDGGIRSLIWDDAPEVRIPSAGIAGGLFRVLPDEGIDLAIEFDTHSSLALRVGDTVRLVPVLTVSLRAPCESLEGSGH